MPSSLAPPDRFRPWKEMPRIFSSRAATFFRRSRVRGSVGADRMSRLLTTLVLAIGFLCGAFTGRKIGKRILRYDLGVEFPACGLPAGLRSDHTNAQVCGRRLANGN